MSAGGSSLKDAGTDADTRRRDVASTRALGSRAIIGGIIGLILGAAIAAGAVALAGLGPDSPGFWIALIGGGIAGSVIGGMFGGVGKLPLSQEWELTYDEEAVEAKGPVRIAVRAGDDKDMERARRVLESEGPDNLEKLGS